MAAFSVSLVTPERILFEGEAEMVTMRSGGGDIAFLANHEPYVSTVEIGLVRIDLADGEKQRFAAHGGFVEVADTVRSFKEILEGKHDDVPEQAFYMQGAIEEVLAQAEKLKATA